MSITAKYAGTCAACGSRFGAGTVIEWSKSGGSRHVTCPGTIVHSKEPLNSPGRAALQGRGRGDFFLGEKTDIVFGWASDHKPHDAELGQAMRAKDGRYLTCVGVAAHWVSQDEADDFDLIGTDGSFSRHWSVSKYYRAATDEEAAPVKVREAEAQARAAAKLQEKQAIEQARRDFDVRLAELTAGLVRVGNNFTILNGNGSEPYLMTWSQGSDYKKLQETTSKITGGRAYRFPHGGYDDYRLDMFVDQATAIEAFRLNRAASAKYGPQTRATAAAWLEKYKGCAGSEYYEWLAQQPDEAQS